jgi:hypothetical protein
MSLSEERKFLHLLAAADIGDGGFRQLDSDGDRPGENSSAFPKTRNARNLWAVRSFRIDKPST